MSPRQNQSAHAFACLVMVLFLGGCHRSAGLDGGGAAPRDGTTLGNETNDESCPDLELSLTECGAADQRLSLSQLDPSHPNYASFLSGCERFLGSLDYANAAVESLEAVRGLRAIDGTLNLFRNRNLQSLDGAESLEVVGEISVRNGAVTSLSALARLRRVRGLLAIESGVESFTGLEQLECVGGLRLGATAVLSVEHFRSLRRVEGDAVIWLSNVPRTDLEAFIGRLEIDGSIEVNGETWR